MSYKSTHTGAQIDAGVTAALNPDATLSNAGELADAKAVGDALANENAAIALKGDAANLATAFDAASTYAIGDLVLYSGNVYRFTSAHTGAWDAGDVEQTTLGEEVEALDAAKADKTDVAAADAALEQMILASFPTDDITNAAVASFPDGADGIPVKRLIVNIEPIQTGAGDPSPGNVRPISGRTLAYVRDTGKNLFDADGLLAATEWVKNADGSYSGMSKNIHYDVFDVQSRCVFKVFNVRKLGMNFTFSAKLSANSDLYVGMAIRNIDTGATRQKQVGSIAVTSVALTSDCAENEYVQSMWFSYGTNKSITMSDIQLEIGTTATAYVPFSGVTHTINFPAAAGTFYGGTLTDNGDGTWTLTVTKAMKQVVSSNSNTFSGGVAAVPGFFEGLSISNPICSHFSYEAGTTSDNTFYGVSSNRVLQIRSSAFSSKAEFNAFLEANTVQIVSGFPSSVTPPYYTLTAESVKTLLGDNNVFADCGDIAELTYRADVGLYIDKKLAEA